LDVSYSLLTFPFSSLDNVNPSKKEDGKSLPEELWLHHMLIDSPGQIFDVAIDEIKKEKVVGVNFEGVGSTLSLVSIAIPRETFLFDIVVLVGGSKFLLPMPLKNILESKKLLKVITSSKSCSRYLLAYSIHMNGILDIQECEKFICTSEGTCWTPEWSINLCAWAHTPKFSLLDLEGGEALLMRPLSSEQKVTATQKASALLLKYDDILKQYLARFHECIDLYLSAWRDISTEERASAAMAMSHKAPPAVVQVLSLKFGEQERKFNRQRAIDEDHNKDDPMPSLLESPAWIKAIRASSHHPSST
ncbi:unnamed protein product, partial [Darwinula stevensoni]